MTAVSSEAHVIPVSDWVEHTKESDCACGPQSVPVVQADGSVNWIIVHHSLDGREKDELTHDT